MPPFRGCNGNVDLKERPSLLSDVPEGCETTYDEEDYSGTYLAVRSGGHFGVTPGPLFVTDGEKSQEICSRHGAEDNGECE